MGTREEIQATRAFADDMQKDYQKLARALARLSSELAAKDGRFLSEEFCEGVARAVEAVQTDRRRVMHCKETFSWPRMPRNFTELDRSITMTETRLQAQEEAAAAKKFLNLVTDDASIRPVLTKAQAALQKILSTAQKRDALRPYLAFMEAFAETDGGKQWELAMKLDPAIFPYAFLGATFMGHQVRFAEKEPSAAAREAAPAKEAEDGAAAAPVEPQEPEAELDAPEENDEAAAAAEKVPQLTAEEREEKAQAIKKQIIETLGGQGMLLPAGYDFGAVTMEMSKKGDGKPSFSAMKSDIQGLRGENAVCARFILQQVRKHRFLTRTFLENCIIDAYPSATYAFALTKLQREGYLRRYLWRGEEAFFAPTPKYDQLCHMEKASEYLKFRRLSKKELGETDDRMAGALHGAPQEAACVAARLAAVRVWERYYTLKNADWDSSSHVTYIGACGLVQFGRLHFAGGRHAVLSWCCTHDEDSLGLYGEFLEKLDEVMEEEDLCDLTLAGMEMAPLKRVLAAILTKHPNLVDTPAYFYLLPEDAFYQEDGTPAPDWYADGVDAEEKAEDAAADVETADVDEDDIDTMEDNESADILVDASEEVASAEEEIVASVNAEEPVASTDEEEPVAPVVPANTGDPAASTDEEEPVAPVVPANAEELAAPTHAGTPADALTQEEEAAETGTTAEMTLDVADEEAVQSAVLAMLQKSAIPQATAALAFCARLAPELWQAPYERLAYAVDDPLFAPKHDAKFLLGPFTPCETIFDTYLAAAAACRTYFSNEAPYDYSMPQLQGMLDQTAFLKHRTPLKNILHALMDFKNENEKGVDFYADYRRKDQKARERQLRQVQQDARSIYENKICGKFHENANLERYRATWEDIYARDGILATALGIVLADAKDRRQDVYDIAKAYFCDEAEDGTLVVTRDRIGDYIDQVWKQNADVSHIKKTSALTGGLDNNAVNHLVKEAGILCRWLALSEDAAAGESAAYQRIRAGLLTDIAQAAKSESRTLAETSDPMTAAGAAVLLRALQELDARLNGSYEPVSAHNFYIDFLRTPDLLLDDDDLPDFRAWHISGAAARYLGALCRHAGEDLPSFEARLDEIFCGQGDGSDDYQTARRIDAYLTVRDGASYLAAKGYDIEKNVPYAAKQMKSLYERFVEELEFAQSCGQLTELGGEGNKKESILAIADDCYRYAEESQNYGVFRRAVAAFHAQIAEDARARGESLQREFAACSQGAFDDEHKAFLDEIERNIEKQNYTVAEDMLTRWDKGDIDLHDAARDQTDDLRLFLAHYGEDYRRVSASGVDLQKLLSGSPASSQRNKRGRGAQDLAKNWIKNPMDGDHMKRLLIALGWNALQATLQGEGADGRNLKGEKRFVFRVTLEAAANRARARYQHPIAIFGSDAERDGFRVLCLFGQYDADNIIATCSALQATLPTLVFLDYALNLQQRRRLARKMKEARLGKTFAVVDRVVIAYLYRNYDEIQVNRMLMMLIMPFAACQPYVPDSGQAMPPEMFMGRKKELRDVESPDGANIVYGGRQLGKSALLKMAQNEIDHDENGDRAILVDLHTCKTVGAAARAISHELTDLRFFHTPCDTEDWDVLARAIANRLREPVDRIPYFLLMLDEADAFIEDCATVDYQPFDALKRIQQIDAAKFKFVIAGLHNIVRFNRESALGQNGVIAHLSHTTVRPFATADARELLETPLRYLGFRFPEEAGSLITLILAHANYFPGLIQLYCKELIRTLAEEGYAGYDEAVAPPYEITRAHVRKVLANKEFREQVREKFMITLRLDSGNDYYIIAYLMASLYHKEGSHGYTEEDLLREAKAQGFQQFATIDKGRLTAFLEELIELNVLRKSADRYFFNRYSFFQMLGSKGEVEEQLYELALKEAGA